MFIKKSETGFAIIAVYVDDMNLIKISEKLSKTVEFKERIRITYTMIRIPHSAEALNARPTTPTTQFSNPISHNG